MLSLPPPLAFGLESILGKSCTHMLGRVLGLIGCGKRNQVTGQRQRPRGTALYRRFNHLSAALRSRRDTHTLSLPCRWTCHVHAQSRPTLYDPLDCGPAGSSAHGICRQEYRSGLPFPSPGDLPDPGIEPRDRTQVSHIAGRFFTS